MNKQTLAVFPNEEVLNAIVKLKEWLHGINDKMKKANEEVININHSQFSKEEIETLLKLLIYITSATDIVEEQKIKKHKSVLGGKVSFIGFSDDLVEKMKKQLFDGHLIDN